MNKRILRLGVLFAVFVCVLFFWYASGKESREIRERVLSNQFLLQGEILDIQKSGNHSFGILLLKPDHMDAGKFVDTLLKTGIFPYKIKDGKVEVYQTIPIDVQKGDKVTVDSDKKTVFYHGLKRNEQYESSLIIITERADINYVKEHTAFK